MSKLIRLTNGTPDSQFKEKHHCPTPTRDKVPYIMPKNDWSPYPPGTVWECDCGRMWVTTKAHCVNPRNWYSVWRPHRPWRTGKRYRNKHGERSPKETET